MKTTPEAGKTRARKKAKARERTAEYNQNKNRATFSRAQDGWDVGTILRHFRELELRRGPWTGKKQVDYKRIEQLGDLNATICWFGTGFCTGYVALGRADRDRIALCRPLVGEKTQVFAGELGRLMVSPGGLVHPSGHPLREIPHRDLHAMLGWGTCERTMPGTPHTSSVTTAPPLLQSEAPRPPVEYVSFEILPAGQRGFSRVIEYYRGHVARGTSWCRGRELDELRLMRIYQLRPVKEHRGQKGWEGYHAFEFANSKRIILDCPFVGNAAYVFSGDWKQTARLSKSEVRSRVSGYQERVVHKGDWLGQLRKALFHSGLQP